MRLLLSYLCFFLVLSSVLADIDGQNEGCFNGRQAMTFWVTHPSRRDAHAFASILGAFANGGWSRALLEAITHIGPGPKALIRVDKLTGYKVEVVGKSFKKMTPELEARWAAWASTQTPSCCSGHVLNPPREYPNEPCKTLLRCETQNFTLAWSSTGRVSDLPYCVQIYEADSPHTWGDNYLCSNENIEATWKWSSKGKIAGMRCNQWLEAADPHTWEDNYLCVPNDYRYTFTFSSTGPVDNQKCIRTLEASDPHTWDDNFLCWT